MLPDAPSSKTSAHFSTIAPPTSEGDGAKGLQLALKLPLGVNTTVPGTPGPKISEHCTTTS